MPRPQPSSNPERLLRGSELGLPLVETLGSTHSRSASRITWHAHPRFELLLLLEGSTAYEFGAGRSVELPGGHFLLVPPGVRHRGLHDVRRPARLCGIVFDPACRQAATHTPFTRADLKWIAEQCRQHAGQPQPMSGELRRLAAALASQVREFRRDAVGAAAAIRLTACATLLEAARQLGNSRAVEPEAAVRLAIQHMETHFTQPLSMLQIARAARCSRARLFVLFKQATGMTPNDYLQRLRVTRCAELLKHTDRSATDIALACGFATSQYFSHVFRKYLDTTPSRYRKLGGDKAESGECY